MMRILSSFLLLVQFHYLLPIVIPVTAKSTHGIEEFSYNEATGKGPSKWGQLSPNWKTCESGHKQSPISINYTNLQYKSRLGPLQTHYKPAIAAATKSHHGVKVYWKGDAGCLTLNGTKYNLIQFHWHWGSEHTLNGSSYGLELHLVHSSPKGLAVVGILYNIGRHDPLLEELLPKLHGLGEGEKDLGMINPRSNHFKKSKYFRYMGSLTTPPCSEGVVWTVIKKSKTVSEKQVEQLKHIVHDTHGSTARPIQQLYGRIVYMYHS